VANILESFPFLQFLFTFSKFWPINEKLWIIVGDGSENLPRSCIEIKFCFDSVFSMYS